MSLQARRRRGRRAEWIAAFWLRLKGYRILARGYRCPAGEIDLTYETVMHAARVRRLS